MASDILTKSRTGWQVEGLPSMVYSHSLSKTSSVQMATNKYDSIGSRGD